MTMCVCHDSGKALYRSSIVLRPRERMHVIENILMHLLLIGYQGDVILETNVDMYVTNKSIFNVKLSFITETFLFTRK